jgi:KDO2-lipid IV(A) lauroyltransferase
MAKKKFYRPILYYLLITARGFFMLLPFRAGFAFGGFLGKAAFYLISKERKKTITHLKIAFPKKPEKELVRLGARTFQNYGYVAAELALIDKLIPHFKDIIQVTGSEHLKQGLAGGKGLIALAAHFGNWEMLAGALAYSGYPGVAIARRIYYDKFDKMLLEIRAKMKLKTIYRDDSSGREVLKALRENRVLGIIADQDVETVDGVFVEFFGRPAYTPTAPVRLALKFKIPLIQVFMIRDGFRHHMIVEPPLELTDTGDPEKDIVTNTQKWATVQERYIRQYPHLWVWNHKRWKTVPKETISV